MSYIGINPGRASDLDGCARAIAVARPSRVSRLQVARQPVTSRASVGYESRVSRLRVARLLPRVLTHRVRKENAD
ncbi:hypothetical protein NDU88_002857 [Pleurodeles waltl]|uniref:Uncharacterized protein n=1 Tax=Pleurodeles waltl TaxID=8319 RepID=A0AAV7WPU5_PLEWA|nr:hypothetical protein NDU88_002857 [Pleurodeles waltl]